jgi:hypothetical protein
MDDPRRLTSFHEVQVTRQRRIAVRIEQPIAASSKWDANPSISSVGKSMTSTTRLSLTVAKDELRHSFELAG